MMVDNKYVYKDFNEFWNMVSRQNPNKVGKIGIMTYEELKGFCENAFYASRRLKVKRSQKIKLENFLKNVNGLIGDLDQFLEAAEKKISKNLPKIKHHQTRT